jgi:hypothetical protein
VLNESTFLTRYIDQCIYYYYYHHHHYFYHHHHHHHYYYTTTTTTTATTTELILHVAQIVGRIELSQGTEIHPNP